MAVVLVLVMQALLLALIALIPPASRVNETLETVPVTFEDWPVFPAAEAITSPKPATPKVTQVKPSPVKPTLAKPREVVANPESDKIPSPEAMSAPTTPVPETPSAPGAVTMPDQRQVMSHMSARNAAGAAVLKHDICVLARTQGKPVAADCPLNPTKQIVIGPRKEVETSRQTCIRKRHEAWKRYRDGKGQYPGLINMFKGNSDCRKDWD